LDNKAIRRARGEVDILIPFFYPQFNKMVYSEKRYGNIRDKDRRI